MRSGHRHGSLDSAVFTLSESSGDVGLPSDKLVKVVTGWKAGHEAAYTYSSYRSSHTRFVLCFFSPCFSKNTQIYLLFLFFFVPSNSRYLYADPLHCNMTYMLLRLLKDDLKEYTYAARLAGLVYGVASGMNAILVSKLSEM